MGYLDDVERLEVVSVSDAGSATPMPRPSWDNPQALSPAEHLARARSLPPLEETMIEDLTDEEAAVFWEAITTA